MSSAQLLTVGIVKCRKLASVPVLEQKRRCTVVYQPLRIASFCKTRVLARIAMATSCSKLGSNFNNAAGTLEHIAAFQ